MGRTATVAPQKILEILAHSLSPLTPEKIAKEAGAPGRGKNVYNVLLGLVKAGSVVRDLETGTYAARRTAGLDRKILAELLSEGRSRQDLARALKPVSEARWSAELDSLVALGLVSELRITMAAGPPEILYDLTPIGATNIDVCFVCRKNLAGLLVVAHVPRNWEALAEGAQAAVHPECLNAFESDPRTSFQNDRFCFHCSLPLVPLTYQLRYVKTDMVRHAFTEWEAERLTDLQLHLGWAAEEVNRRRSKVNPFVSSAEFDKLLVTADLGNVPRGPHRQDLADEVLVARARLCQFLDDDLNFFADELVRIMYAGSKDSPPARLKGRVDSIKEAAAKVEETSRLAWSDAFRQLLGPQGVALNQLEPHWARANPPEELGFTAMLQLPSVRAQQGCAIRREGKWFHPFCARETADLQRAGHPPKPPNVGGR